MSRTFRTPLALTAVLALLAGPVLAQDAAPAAPVPPAAAAPAAEAQAPALPKVLQDAGLTDVTTKRARGGSSVEGKLPDGNRIQAMLTAEGALRGIKAQGDAALPQALVEQLVPQVVRDNAVFAELGSLRAVFTGERGVMLAGQDAEKNRIRAAFAEDGTLLRFARGDDDHDRKDRGRDHGKRHDDRRGDRDHHWGDKRDHDRREGRGPDAPRPTGDAPERAAIAPEALRQALTAAGYTQLGEITQDGPRVTAQANNPEGEPVLLELNPQGRVVREIAR